MKPFAILSYFATILLILLFLHTLKDNTVPIPTKERLTFLLFILAFFTLIWISIALVT